MDRQHRTLVDMINKVHDLLAEGKTEEAMAFFKREVTLYVERHFSDEERFMREIGYPDLENHKKAHDQFRKLMLSLLAKMEGNVKEFRTGLALVLGWLYSHIMKVDKKYGEFYRGRS